MKGGEKLLLLTWPEKANVAELCTQKTGYNLYPKWDLLLKAYLFKSKDGMKES